MSGTWRDRECLGSYVESRYDRHDCRWCGRAFPNARKTDDHHRRIPAHLPRIAAARKGAKS